MEQRLERLTGIVEALASTVVSHDDQIERLIKVGEAQQKSMDALKGSMDELRGRIDDLAKSVAVTERQWQAYIKTLPRQ